MRLFDLEINLPYFVDVPTTDEKKHRVLFICTGNTCRSPMAQGLMAKAMADQSDWVVESAGVAASVGSCESRDTATVLAERSATLQGFRSRQVSEEILAQAQAVFCMTAGHKEVLLDEFPEFADKCYLLCDFSTSNPGGDVPDPIGMGQKAYQRVAKTIEDAIPGMMRFLLAKKNVP